MILFLPNFLQEEFNSLINLIHGYTLTQTGTVNYFKLSLRKAFLL